jgi:MFS family permease
VASLYYALISLSALCAGWSTDTLIRRGAGRTVVRKSAMAFGYLLGALTLTGCACAGPPTYLIALFVGALAGGVSSSGTFVFPQILAGPAAAGRWVGLQNGIANVAGVIGPALTGLLVGKTGNYTVPIVVTALFSLAGALCYTLVIEKLEPVPCTALPGALPALAGSPGAS